MSGFVILCWIQPMLVFDPTHGMLGGFNLAALVVATM
jgi:hypothetical protein